MASAPPKRHAPSGIGTTGTTGIILTTNDLVMWQSRIRKEDLVHAKVHPEGFAVRNALKLAATPAPPQRWRPGEASEGNVERSRSEQDSRDAQEAMLHISRRKSLPRHLHAFTETSFQEPGFILVNAGPPPGSSGGLARSATLPPGVRPTSTYAALLPCLESAASKRHRRRERNLEEAEASIEQAMAEQRRFLNKAGASGVFRPRVVTDATTFDDCFLKKIGVPLYKARPSDAPVLKMRNGQFAAPWAP
mmetsp:Transcript_12575/g.36130  ORF Transcript_12575/g.36130 Transcript_12575/m.36130 type:complete len:249 (-) Transcript_12575:188-934(-)|eukprot:CAMPEP_0176203650 /NCGR_PEP_ID=MMETSP0121_2-20121125/10687_1 /TAXON_ID=160619 /ORGANISM="Kryptoperidinium foliaceum, Strain CCMP 1326" /LENGTH=248 /DNA_ID=CAMNT_0017542557 /DNA_START=39 /DNA_END=785 /DNA_ORIENTATION=+